VKNLHTCPPMKMEQTECSETSAHKIQTPGNYPEESVQQKLFDVLDIKETNKRMTSEHRKILALED
jgi:hypothetical protein